MADHRGENKETNPLLKGKKEKERWGEQLDERGWVYKCSGALGCHRNVTLRRVSKSGVNLDLGQAENNASPLLQ